MRKLFITTMVILLCTGFVKAKTTYINPTADSTRKAKDTTAANKQLIRTAANLKSGTSQDVLTSFFKLGYSDISNSHHLQFNSSLFAVRAKTDTTLWTDTRYKRQVFSRNFTFGIDYGLDSNYKFKSASFNVKYAIINNRDKDFFNFSYGKKLDTILNISNQLFNDAEQIYFREGHSIKKEGALIGNYFNYKKRADKTSKEDLPKRYVQILDSLLKEKQFIAIKDFQTDNLRDSLSNLFGTASALMQQRSLWTIGSQLTADQQQLFNRVNFNTEYLKGITKNNTSMGLELDIKANLDIYDTTTVIQPYHRKVLSGSAGINWIIYKDKATQKSYVEFKPALTYNNILSGQLAGETKSKFTGDGTLRFRITDELWIPVDVKYDPQAGKFFGFISIISNFDWLGSKTSTMPNN